MIRRLTRRASLILAAAGLAIGLALQGCAQSPATGRNIFTGGLSPEDEVKLGREQHPEIVRDEPGSCDICGMPLVRAESLGYVTPDTDALPPPVVAPCSE